jgi:tetratricopeptide (TPR) repeat protein
VSKLNHPLQSWGIPLGQVLVLLTLPFLLFSAACTKTRIDVQVSDALRLGTEGGAENWKKACRKIEYCVKNGITDTNVINFYIICLYRVGNREKAIKLALEQLALKPENFILNYLAGKMFFEGRDYGRSIRYLRMAQESKPDHVDSLVVLANCAGKLNLPLAENSYLRMLTMNQYQNSYLAFNGLAVSYAHGRKYPQAMSAFSRALKLSDYHPLVYLNIAIFNDQFLNKPQLAKSYYEKFLGASESQYPVRSKKVLARLEMIEKQRR